MPPTADVWELSLAAAALSAELTFDSQFGIVDIDY